MTTLYAIYGASGCGRSLMPVAIEQLKRNGRYKNTGQIVFIDDALNEDSQVNGYIALNYAKFKSLNIKNKFVLIAIANSTIQEYIANKIASDNIPL